jgi:hypothetical protein
VLLFSRLMGERFADTAIGQHFTPATTSSPAERDPGRRGLPGSYPALARRRRGKSPRRVRQLGPKRSGSPTSRDTALHCARACGWRDGDHPRPCDRSSPGPRA